jgi:predicted N-acyltransferase
MADRIALVMAFRDGPDDRKIPIAGALNLIGRDALYGRQWGALEEVPFLHFELCYYRAIEFAIERGLSRVEAGAQGEHKIARGYLPSPVYSAHFIADPALRAPVADYLDRERPAVEMEIAALTAELSPFRKAD